MLQYQRMPLYLPLATRVPVYRSTSIIPYLRVPPSTGILVLYRPRTSIAWKGAPEGFDICLWMRYRYMCRYITRDSATTDYLMRLILSGVGRGRKGAWMWVQVRGFKFASSRTLSHIFSGGFAALKTIRSRLLNYGNYHGKYMIINTNSPRHCTTAIV